ncbi:zinc finger CCCH domain-containing protein 14-like isoform X2 [Watersipora subatra]|uniref:zinc finger CCCH domain-containing protein 14-like isoform X2 n=1 Tax=Watersipora subatra TaxID=2589382 RepID=UPI00355BBB12
MDREEISEKIRQAIKAKLTEMGSYIDDELPDYIMVMIANKRDISQMSSDLDLFLAENSKPFTQWLDNLLTRLQSVTKSVTAASKPHSQIPDTDLEGLESSKEAVKSESGDEAADDSALLTLHAQEDDEVAFDDDNDEPVEPSKPISAKPITKPSHSKESLAPSKPLVQEMKPAIPDDLLAGRRRMISTRGDSDMLLSKSTARSSRNMDMGQHSGHEGKSGTHRSPVRQKDSPRRDSSPGDHRQASRLERRQSPGRRSPGRRIPSSFRIGSRGESRDNRNGREYHRSRDDRGEDYHRSREEKEDTHRSREERDGHHRPREERDANILTHRDVYKPNFLDRSVGRPFVRVRRPVWQEDTRGRETRDRSPRSAAGLSSQIASACPQVDLVSDSSEEEYGTANPKTGSMASVIKIADRKSSVPAELQANNKLLLKAMADVTKSFGPPSLEVHDLSSSSERSSKAQKPKRLPAKDRIGLARSKPPMFERLQGWVPREYSRSRSRSPMRSNDLDNYDERELMERLKVIQERKKQSQEAFIASHISKKEIHSPSKIRQRQASEDVDIADIPQSPNFVVTLDGATEMSKLFNRTFGEDELERLETLSTSPEEDLSLDNNVLPDDTSNTLCRFLPHCKAGDACLFYHPMCKNLSNCRFGSACKYKHPKMKTASGAMCKYDRACTRPTCPFTHSKPQAKLVSTGPASRAKSLVNKPKSKTVCKYHPKCTIMDCQYLHPKPCKYGISCLMRNSGCIFTHPSLPSKDQLRWSKTAVTSG